MKIVQSKIIEDDYFKALVLEFKRILRETQDLKIATKTFIEELGTIESNNSRGFFWVSLGEVQWRYGYGDPEVIEKIKDSYGYNTNQEMGIQKFDIEALKSVVEDFLEKIESENPSPHPIPESSPYKPIFKKGDCLVICHDNGEYGGAIVLATDQGEMAQNLICSLDYLSKTEPSMEVFEERKWLMLSHHHWNDELDLGWYGPIGFEEHQNRIKKVGRTKITLLDPDRSLYALGWIQLGCQILFEQEWKRKEQ
jgi:hypothetical protein